jgi:hypothetical protein
MDTQHRQVSQCIKLELSLEQSNLNTKKKYDPFFFINECVFHRRDFRQSKVDPNTGKVVPNPVKWVEMKENIEIV